MKTKIQIQKHNYYVKHRKSLIAKSTLWNKEHKDKRKIISKRDNEKRKFLKRLWHERKWFSGDHLLDEDSKCFLCKTKDNLIIHHIDGQNGRNGNSFNNDKENLMTLCRKCHPTIHNRWWTKEVGVQ